MIDYLDALTAYLRHDSQVSDLAATRIYPAELPATEATAMPRYAVVLVPSGGDAEASQVRLHAPRVDVFCYGATPKAARMLALTVARSLQDLARANYAATLLHSAVPTGGPWQGRTPEAWPLAWSSWQIHAGTEDAS